MPQLQFVSGVLLRSGFIPIKNLKSGRTSVNTVKIPIEKTERNRRGFNFNSFILSKIKLFYINKG